MGDFKTMPVFKMKTNENNKINGYHRKKKINPDIKTDFQEKIFFLALSTLIFLERLRLLSEDGNIHC